MIISQKMNDALNVQIGNEFGASMQYVAISCHFGVEASGTLRALSAAGRRGADARHEVGAVHRRRRGHVVIPQIPRRNRRLRLRKRRCSSP